MASVGEIQTTFKDLQEDERYQKLKRTLKTVLLKNAQGQCMVHGNTNKWPSVSSINGDNLDASCTAISNQSYTTSSEIVSASANMRNIMFHKQQFDRRNKIPLATSSENQFPIKKNNNDDSAMMPPPSTPIGDFGRLKKFKNENTRSPLVNIETSRDKNDSGLSLSVPTNSMVNTSKSTGSISTTSSGISKGKHSPNDNICQSPYGKDKGNSRSTERQKRIFHKWRVLLNDQGQLIVKGTLECGKIARSKPVLRRLTCTSVQSIYKCTYHLIGNLVDERQELPDYVSGKFYNGFPDDWDNVHQLWRNYVSDGCKLNFRWPTPITDSDDDIKSGVTDISYCQKLDEHKKSRSARKRTKTLKIPCENSLLPTDNVNDLDHNSSDKFLKDIHEIPIEKSAKLLKNLPQSSSKNPHRKESLKVDAKDKSETSHETSNISLVSSEITDGTSLKDIIQEDKLNIIIDNLTNKNCSIDYINKMAVMLDCMKYVVSYQSTDTDGSDRNDRSNPVTKVSRTPDKHNPLMEDTNNRGSPLQCSPLNSIRSRNGSRVIGRHNQKVDRPNIDENLRKVRHPSQVRRNLSKHDYDSESDTDYHNGMRKPMNSHSAAHERIHSSQKCKNPSTSTANKMQFHSTEKPLDDSYESEKHGKKYLPRSKRYNSRLTDEEFEIEERSGPKEARGTEFTNPRTCRGNIGRMEKNFQRKEDNSSYSVTEDEDGSYRENTRVKETKREQYHSDISITEDEHGGTRNSGRRPDALEHYRDSRSIEIDVQTRRNDRNDRNKMKSLKHYGESKTRPVDSDIRRNASGQENYRNPPTYDRPIAYDSKSCHTILADRTSGRREDTDCRSPDEPVAEVQGNLNRLSAHTTRQKNIDANRELAKTESIKKYTASRSREIDFQRNSDTFQSPPEKIKNSRVPNKPKVMSDEVVNVNLKHRKWHGRNENDKNVVKTRSNGNDRSETTVPSVDAQNSPSVKMSTRVMLECTVNSKLSNAKSTIKETNALDVDTLDYKTLTVDQFGSKDNPKPLSTWIPVVICDDDDSKCRLHFNGKLLNEAGHTLYRKFSTDFVKRRWTPKLIETDDGVFYELAGEMKDTKHAVPKELINLCHDGCPSDIRYFCEQWKSYLTESYKTPSKPQNVSVDFLNVPISSRGRRILPPLNYWAGERITTKGSEVIYDPGNCQELSLPSLLETINEKTTDRRTSRRTHLSPSASALKVNGNRTKNSSASASKKKESVKVSSPNGCKTFTKKTEKTDRSRGTLNSKRRHWMKLIDTSSESDDSGTEKTTRVQRKDEIKKRRSGMNADTIATRILRSSKLVSPSFDSLGNSMWPRHGSFEDSDDCDIEVKLRKRLKTLENEGEFAIPTTSKQSTSKRSSRISRTHYENLPLCDNDFSEDQSSIIRMH